MAKLKELCSIYAAFFKIGIVTFGGGYSMLPILEHELDKKRGWVSKQTLLDYFAIGQTLPGIIAVNVATFVGSRRKGFLGAAAAALGVVSPSIIVISVIAAFISNLAEYPIVQKLLFGMNIGVAALLVQSVLSMAKKAVIDWVTLLLVVAGFVSVAFFGLHNVILLALGIAVGLLMRYKKEKAAGAPDGGTRQAPQSGTAEPDALQSPEGVLSNGSEATAAGEAAEARDLPEDAAAGAAAPRDAADTGADPGEANDNEGGEAQ